MSNDVTWWKTPDDRGRNQNEQDPGTELPGDTDAGDIVGRTGEEMPEVAHDEGPDHLEDHETEV